MQCGNHLLLYWISFLSFLNNDTENILQHGRENRRDKRHGRLDTLDVDWFDHPCENYNLCWTPSAKLNHLVAHHRSKYRFKRATRSSGASA